MNNEIKHFHLFCGLGGGAAGFNQGEARIGNLQAKFRCLGGIDVDPAAIADFDKLAGVKGTVLDMFSREQFTAFHGCEPGNHWSEAGPQDIQQAAGGESPNIVFLSAPCKGFSGLLSQAKSGTDKYQALNELTVRGVWLALEAFKNDPADLYIFENVPRIAARGRRLLDQITALFRHYGYAVAETTHDCGELGGLAQSRRRFLLVARHIEKVPAYLYEPTKRPLRSVGDILGRMPLPGDIETAGPMHRIPSLQWKTWVRLAFVEAGSDWRSLNKLTIENGHLKDFLIVPECHAGFLGVNQWDSPTGTIRGKSGPTNGNFSIADPRFYISEKWKDGQAYGVRHWDKQTGTITGQQSPGQGAFSVADPRGTSFAGKYSVTKFDAHANTVIAGSTTGQGAFAIADPRAINRTKGDAYLTGGHYGVVPWAATSGAVSAAACHDNGFWSVADPRLPAQTDKLVAVIRALDGTWHRPFTTLELAALQGLYDADEALELDGLNDSAWRERIGNAVPPPAAKAIASMMGEALLLARSGETFTLSSTPVWVRPVAMALSVSHQHQGGARYAGN